MSVSIKKIINLIRIMSVFMKNNIVIKKFCRLSMLVEYLYRRCGEFIVSC